MDNPNSLGNLGIYNGVLDSIINIMDNTKLKPKPTITSILKGFCLITIIILCSIHKIVRIDPKASNDVPVSDLMFFKSYHSPITIKEHVLGSLMSGNRRIITAYSSTPDQTDDTPFITANGTRVRNGIVATNDLPFGTIIEIEGLGIFEVNDRMNSRYINGEMDVWMETREQALEFGKQEIMACVRS